MVAAVSSGCRRLSFVVAPLASSGVSAFRLGRASVESPREAPAETSGVWLLWSFASRASARCAGLEWHAGGGAGGRLTYCNGRASAHIDRWRTPALTWAGLASWCPST